MQIDTVVFFAFIDISLQRKDDFVKSGQGILILLLGKGLTDSHLSALIWELFEINQGYDAW